MPVAIESKLLALSLVVLVDPTENKICILTLGQ
jgi:hypothetical protein